MECDTWRVLVYSERGIWNHPTFVPERLHYRRNSLMLWDGISINKRTDLHIIRNKTLKAQRYARETESWDVILLAQTSEIPFFFSMIMPDRIVLWRTCFKLKQFSVWNCQHAFLNPIEHVWNILRRRIAAIPRPPFTTWDSKIALLEEWNSIPQSLWITSSSQQKTGVQKS